MQTKKSKQKLSLSRETVRSLSDESLKGAAGGKSGFACGQTALTACVCHTVGCGPSIA